MLAVKNTRNDQKSAEEREKLSKENAKYLLKIITRLFSIRPFLYHLILRTPTGVFF